MIRRAFANRCHARPWWTYFGLPGGFAPMLPPKVQEMPAEVPLPKDSQPLPSHSSAAPTTYAAAAPAAPLLFAPPPAQGSRSGADSCIHFANTMRNMGVAMLGKTLTTHMTSFIRQSCSPLGADRADEAAAPADPLGVRGLGCLSATAELRLPPLPGRCRCVSASRGLVWFGSFT